MLLMIGFGMALFLRGHDLASPYGKRVTACALLVQTVVGIGLPVLGYLVGPDWMWMYYVDHRDLPGWMAWYLLLVLYWIPFGAAYLLGAWLSRKGQRPVVVAFALATAAQIAIIGMTFDRYVHMGTTEEYRAGQAALLPQSSAAATLNAGAAVAALSIAAVWWYLRRLRRHLTA